MSWGYTPGPPLNRGREGKEKMEGGIRVGQTDGRRGRRKGGTEEGREGRRRERGCEDGRRVEREGAWERLSAPLFKPCRRS